MKHKPKKGLLSSLFCAFVLLFTPTSFSACEKDNLPNVTITQTATVEYDYSVLPEYKDFKSIAKREYLVPGLNEGIVPQGMDVWEEKNLLFIAGYFESQTNTSGSPSSMIVVIDLKTGEMAGKYCLENVDGTPHMGHVGGLAVTEKNIFLTTGRMYRIPLSQIETLGKSGTLKIVEVIKVPVKADFCNYSDGILWTGDFYYNVNGHGIPEWRHMTNTVGGEHYAWAVGYKVKDTESEFSSENWNASTMEYATPDYVLSITERIQGFTFVGDQIVLSQSYGRHNNSSIIVYNNTLQTEQDTNVTLNGKSVPLWFLDSSVHKKTYTIIPMSEGVTSYNGNLLVVFETGTKKYRNAKSPTDHVWSMALPE